MLGLETITQIVAILTDLAKPNPCTHPLWWRTERPTLPISVAFLKIVAPVVPESEPLSLGSYR